MFSQRSLYALLILAAMPVASCSCQETLHKSSPKFQASPSSLSYGLVCLESDHQLTVEVQNVGAGVGHISWTVVAAPGASGDFDPAMFSTSPEADKTLLLSASQKQVITVSYAPSDASANGQSQKAKAHKAILQISTDDPEHDPIEVVLDGNVSDRDPTPIFSVECDESEPRCDGSGGRCCTSQKLGEEAPEFGRSKLTLANMAGVAAGSIGEMKVKISNLGCGELKIPSTWTFDSATSDGCPGSTLTIPEIDGAGLSIPGSATENGIQSRLVTLSFTAPDDECTLFGDAVLSTNDPEIQSGSGADWAALSVTASSAPPAIAIKPSGGLSYGEVKDGDCVEKEATIVNNSSLPVKLTNVLIESTTPGKDSDYTITKKEYAPDTVGCAHEDWNIGADGTNLGPTTPPLACGPDEVFVTIKYCPGSGNDLTTDNDVLVVKYVGGQIRYPVHGGSNPALVVRGQPDLGWFYGPHHFGCVACGFGLCPAAECRDDNDCSGERCLKGEGETKGNCESAPACVNRCGVAGRTFEMCNEGKGDLVIHSIKSEPPNGLAITPSPGDCFSRVLKTDDCCVITAVADATVLPRSDFVPVNWTVDSNDPTFPPTFPVNYTFEMDTPDEFHVPIAHHTIKDESCADVTKVVQKHPLFIDFRGSTNAVNYTWELVTKPSDSLVPSGVINPATADPQFFDFGMACDGAASPNTAVMKFTPDVGKSPIANQYQFRVTVDAGSCTDDKDKDPDTFVIDVTAK